MDGKHPTDPENKPAEENDDSRPWTAAEEEELWLTSADQSPGWSGTSPVQMKKSEELWLFEQEMKSGATSG